MVAASRFPKRRDTEKSVAASRGIGNRRVCRTGSRLLATRYNKIALTYRGGVVLRAITIWLKLLGDTP
jgi:hypothetical protein